MLISTKDGRSGQPVLHHRLLGSADKESDLWVRDSVMSSPSRFYPLEHFIKTPEPPTIASTFLLVPVFDQASFSVLLSNSLSWAGN